jgi:nicotinamidase-related amidase
MQDKNIKLVIIDPQYDFCNPKGALYVPGADEDMKRLALFIHKHMSRINDIYVSLDLHVEDDISHALWFVNEKGYHPTEFTQITALDMKEGRWRSFNEGKQDSTLEYLENLERLERYPHTIWPMHCILGTPGTKVVQCINDALHEFSATGKKNNIRTKGVEREYRTFQHAKGRGSRSERSRHTIESKAG